MILRAFIVEGTGCASYFFGCPSRRQFAVVDPHPDHVEDYIEAAQRTGGEIVQIFDTHVHADHHSAGLELARRTGAALRLPVGAPVEYEFEPLRDGERVEMGNTKVDVLLTPGHVWEHASLLVTDEARGPDPWLVFTGDTLFVNAVGRPDLHGEERALAAELHRSLAERLMSLPDWVEVYPGHIGGSACGAGISPNPFTTIGYERRNNPLATEPDLEAFTERLLAQQTPPPPEFAQIYEPNRAAS
jgi:glyoxylase-like metal-dependent hydrolase (beta-lactamase superfamily II)